MAAAILLFSTALKGVEPGSILPIIKLVSGSTDLSNASGSVQTFAQVYQALGIPFRLQFMIAGVLSVIGLRYLSGVINEYRTAAVRAQC